MAATTAIARRYADAYFGLARDAGSIEAWGRDLQHAAEMLGSTEVAAAMRNPRLSASKRAAMVMGLLEGLGEPARNLARLLVERNRSAVLPQIAEHYQRLADRESGLVRAEVTTAVDLDDSVKNRIVRALEEKLGVSVKTEVKTDPSILGGMVVRIGDRVIDDSVRTHLQQLQTSLA